jgi:hypothetical protein
MTKPLSMTAFYEQHKGEEMSKSTGFSIVPSLLDPYHIPNIREKLDEEHIQYFKQAFLAGEPVEPIVVLNAPLETGLLAVVEGRHRTHGALLAAKEMPGLKVEVRLLSLRDAYDRYSFMLKSDRRKEFTYLERSLAVSAMKAMDAELTNQDLADEQHCSKTAIENYLLCAMALPVTHDLIREGRITGTQVTEYVRKFGAEEAHEQIMADLGRMERKGTTSKKAPGVSKFSHAKCLTAMEILLNVAYDAKQLAKDNGEVSLKLGIEDAKDLISIIDEYQDHCGLEE